MEDKFFIDIDDGVVYSNRMPYYEDSNFPIGTVWIFDKNRFPSQCDKYDKDNITLYVYIYNILDDKLRKTWHYIDIKSINKLIDLNFKKIEK